jgi:hypothetical protein
VPGALCLVVLLLCSFAFTWGIARFDLYEGLTTAGDVFVEATLTALQQLEQVHNILLVGTMVVLLVQICCMLVPFRRQLVRESLQLAGLLSMLPQVSRLPLVAVSNSAQLRNHISLPHIKRAHLHRLTQAAGNMHQ